MQQTFEITGMHCGGCVNRVTKALKGVAQDASVTLDPPRAVIEVAAPLPLETVKAAVAKAGDFEVRAL
jgi:copper chaperone CopZ